MAKLDSREVFLLYRQRNAWFERLWNELCSMADWTERYGAALNPLSHLEEVLKEFKRQPNPYGWNET
jgi:hypothetical protein